MNRGQFLRSLFLVAASPKVLAEIKERPKVTSSLFKDLQLVMPNYYKHYVEKYGSQEFTWWLSAMGNDFVSTQKFYHFENGKVSESTEPVTVTINL